MPCIRIKNFCRFLSPLFAWILLVSCFPIGLRAQDTVLLTTRSYNAVKEVTLIDSTWFFHREDFPPGQKILTSTKGWQKFQQTDFDNSSAPKNWNGTGWFGIWLKTDSTLAGKKLAIRINHDGASEIFVDGKEVGGYGKVGGSAKEMQEASPTKQLIPFRPGDMQPHLVVVHYSNFIGIYPDFLGFQLFISDYDIRQAKLQRSNNLLAFVPMFAAAQIILGLLHLLLFLFYPKQKANLLYALLVLIIGINNVCVYLYYQSQLPTVQYLAEFLTHEWKVLMLCTGIMLLYMLNYGRIPRTRLIILSVVSGLYFIGYILRYTYFPSSPWPDQFDPVILVFILDGFWSAVSIIRHRQKAAWLVGVGVVAVILIYLFAWGDVFALWPYKYDSLRVFVMSAGQLLFPLCLSVYLALDVARTNQHLSEKLLEVETLSRQALTREAEKRELISGESKRLEQLVQQRTATLQEQTEKLREMDLVKSRFFTNITHEFKTPLTLIINPAKELLFTTREPASKKQLGLMLKNAERLLQLINQLLDLSKMENGSMEINLATIDLVSLINSHIISHESLTKQKGLDLIYITPLQQFLVVADRDKLDKIIVNIISNAVKFTEQGKIEISLGLDPRRPGEQFIFSVRDAGKGIPAAKLPYIFSRFYQADPSDTRSAEGTGIGLALTKELVEILGGTIRAESEEHRFTEIIVEMPYLAAIETDDERIDEGKMEHPGAEPDSGLIPKKITGNEVVDTEGLFVIEEKPLVLLIEDNADLREFIEQTLSLKFRVITAPEGETGIVMAFENIPNLVITDLMMPRIDGYEVTATLKKDQRTSHVPIIMLTAKSGTENRILGIETGADSYLEKPFDKRELFALADNLMILRTRLQQHYHATENWMTEDSGLPSIEQDFLSRVKAAVESHMNEEGYTADQLARDIGLSRTQLHRKLKALIGQAPGELIRVVRLQHAHDLLKRRIATITEVSYMVGFGSPASFSASFSKHFGYPPKKV